ncbi:MAG TPA: glycogen debranching protein GlgX [Gammaproteobacteria bacterium]|nr:glycogen debranching protein GlgX [Gammaproteobacteria bacterium]
MITKELVSENVRTSPARYATRPGSRFPSGAMPLSDGVNFSIFSRHATRVELLLYATPESEKPFQIVELEPDVNRTFFFWHVFVEGLPLGTCYTWRMQGPTDIAESGRCFYPRKELVDPWAHAVSDARWSRGCAADPDDGGSHSLRAILAAKPEHSKAAKPEHSKAAKPASSYEARPPSVYGAPVAARSLQAEPTLAGAIIYELHVGAFTRHPSSGVKRPGTFEAIIEKIPYLADLGVTHVELLPVMAFDEQDVPAAAARQGLRNLWGYSTHSFYSPHPRYCVDPARAPQEFRALVDALHGAGIRVLLDVVFNHTAEGGAGGPIINFKGIGNDVFYLLDGLDRRRYRDYTGCGNTVNCNHPLVTAFIVHCLEYWVEELGVDGFRFDLASVFARDQRGEPMADPPVPWAMEASRTLSRVPLIAEAWDAAGLYQVGAFPGMSWSEWNGRYRDSIRRFVRGDPGLVADVAARICGSADLYAGGGRLPANSVNFITCHDGFTLNDLVSYDGKHNEANCEDNRDGANDNASWNCGVEGPTDDRAVSALRRRQARNFIAILLLSRGVPMLLAGDEVLRTQRGNNNAWCQDNELSWFDWTLVESNHEMLRFTRELIALRRRHASLTANRFFDGNPVPGRRAPDIAWHGTRLDEPGWGDPLARFLGFTIAGVEPDEEDLHVMINMWHQSLDAEVPQFTGKRWHVAVDTSRPAPRDAVEPARQRPHSAASYSVYGRSVVVLESRVIR